MQFKTVYLELEGVLVNLADVGAFRVLLARITNVILQALYI